MTRQLKPAGRSLRQWGLLAVSVAVVTLSVSEALGAYGPLRGGLLSKLHGGGVEAAEPESVLGSSLVSAAGKRKRPVLVTNAGRKALFRLPKLAPDRATARCVRVAYRGPRRARVHLFATRGTAALARYVMVTVTRGRMPATHNGACTRFVPDKPNYVGAGPGVLFRGPLSTFPKTLKVATHQRGPRAWRNKETHAYRFVLTLVSSNAAQGLSTNFNLTWQAQS